MTNVSDKSCRQNQNAHFVFFLNCTVYEIMWKYMAQPDRPQRAI